MPARGFTGPSAETVADAWITPDLGETSDHGSRILEGAVE